MNFKIRNIIRKILDHTKTYQLQNGINEEADFERCVICGAVTTIRKDTHIEFRANYEVGCGQICAECAKKLRNRLETENILWQTKILLAAEQSRKETDKK